MKTMNKKGAKRAADFVVQGWLRQGKGGKLRPSYVCADDHSSSDHCKQRSL